MPEDTLELRQWAIRILSADRLEDKLSCPAILTDHEPGPVMHWNEPVRPQGMQFGRRSKEEKLPSFQDHHDPDKRAICLHRFAGHELLAVEIMAYALLAFPDAPASFRKGLAHTLKDEQRHVRLYADRLKGLGVEFGSMPLYKHFWSHVPFLTSPLRYISTMSLTFEQANLDFAPMYGASFLHHGDTASADLMGIILEDEIAHVRFGWQWLKRWREGDQTLWETFCQAQADPLNPKRAKGFLLHREHRLRVGMDEEWICNLEAAQGPTARKCPNMLPSIV